VRQLSANATMNGTNRALGHNLKFQKRLAMSILNCGRSKAWLDPDRRQLIAKARTRAEMRTLISAGLIKKKVKEFKQPMDRDEKLNRRYKLRLARKEYGKETSVV